MSSLILLVLPIFLVIFLGKALQITIVKSPDVWAGINTISYWVLFPAFLFYEVAKLDLSNPHLINYSTSLIVGFVMAMVFAYVIGRLTGIDSPALTSVMQGAGRHNTFVGLAVAAQLFGPEGAAVGTIATATLVPISNVFVVIMMATMLNKSASFTRILHEVIRNPIILAIVAGFIFNAFHLHSNFVLYEFTGMLGKATLPVLLLVIGAHLRFGGLHLHAFSTVISIVAKMLVFPITTFGVCVYYGLSTEMTVIAVIFAACPTASVVRASKPRTDFGL